MCVPLHVNESVLSKRPTDIYCCMYTFCALIDFLCVLIGLWPLVNTMQSVNLNLIFNTLVKAKCTVLHLSTGFVRMSDRYAHANVLVSSCSLAALKPLELLKDTCEQRFNQKHFAHPSEVCVSKVSSHCL